MRRMSFLLLLASASLCWIAPASVRAEDVPATQPSAGEQTAQVRQKMQHLIDEIRATPAVSADPKCLQHFGLTVSLRVPSPGGRTAGADYLIERDGPRLRIVGKDLQGRPFVMATNGILIRSRVVASSEVDQLQVYSGGNPYIRLAAVHNRPKLVVEIGFRSDVKDADATVDVASLLAHVLEQLQDAKVSAANDQIVAHTPDAEVTIGLDEPPSDHIWALSRLQIVNRQGISLTIADAQREDQKRPLADVTLDTLKGLGVSYELNQAPADASILMPVEPFEVPNQPHAAADALGRITAIQAHPD